MSHTAGLAPDLTAVEAAVALEAHYLRIDVNTTQLRRTIGGKDDDFGIDPEIAEALSSIGRTGGFSLVAPEFIREFEKRRKAAQRARDSFSTPYQSGAGPIYLIPQSRLEEVEEAISRHEREFEEWKRHAELEAYEAEVHKRFNAYYRVLRDKYGQEKADQFRDRVIPRIATAAQMRGAEITHWVDKLELNVGATNGLSQSAREAVLRHRSLIALKMARDIPGRIAAELSSALDLALQQENLAFLPEHVRNRVKAAGRFAIDNNFNARDPLVPKGAKLCDRILLGDAKKEEVLAMQRSFAMQKKLYERREHVLAAKNQPAAPTEEVTGVAKEGKAATPKPKNGEKYPQMEIFEIA
jgi:hypothetical protein